MHVFLHRRGREGLHLGCLGGRDESGGGFLAHRGLYRAHQRGQVTYSMQQMTQKVGGGGLSVRARHAPRAQLLTGIIKSNRRRPTGYGSHIGNDNSGDVHVGKKRQPSRIGQHCPGPSRGGVRTKLGAMHMKPRHRHKQLATAHHPVIDNSAAHPAVFTMNSAVHGFCQIRYFNPGQAKQIRRVGVKSNFQSHISLISNRIQLRFRVGGRDSQFSNRSPRNLFKRRDRDHRTVYRGGRAMYHHSYDHAGVIGGKHPGK